LGDPTAIDIIASTNRNGSPFYESVLVEPVGNGRYVVLASPGLVEGIAAGDEIEPIEGQPGAYRVLTRGGNACIQFFWRGDIDRCERELLPEVEALGGRLDGRTDGLLVFTIPASAGFTNIEAFFTPAQSEYDGCIWMYGNVYDPADGVTPLNWWK
jgi:hypothetical protein